MKLENVKVGEAYTLKVGKNLVAVTVKGVDAKGKITVASAGGKQMTVADAGRLTARTVADDVGRPSAKQAAHGATGKASATKGTKAVSGRKRAHDGAPQAKEKRVGLVDAAISVMREAKKPMGTKDIVEVVLAKKLWSTSGKTPGATLFRRCVTPSVLAASSRPAHCWPYMTHQGMISDRMQGENAEFRMTHVALPKWVTMRRWE